MAVRGDDAYDVAQDVCLRLLRELQKGRRYPVPWRVVVHQVITWTIKGHFQKRGGDSAIPDGWDPPVEELGFDEFAEGHDLEALFEQLPDSERLVMRLRYLDGLEIDEIAAQLAKERNAIDQTLWRAHRRLREVLGGA